MKGWSKDRIALVKVRIGKASPGPWRHGRAVGRTLYNGGDFLIGLLDLNDDANFIAHARTDLPEAIAEIERLQALLKRMEESGERN